MSKKLIKSLLAIHQQEKRWVPNNKMMSEFCAAYSVGEVQGTRVYLTSQDRDDIAMILEKAFGVDASTPPDAWDDLSRAEALEKGHDEKLASSRVKDGLVYMKALPGRRLHVNGKALDLPDGAHMAISLKNLSIGDEHQSILLVENWENFEHTHNTPLLFQSEGNAPALHANPLILYRGDTAVSPAHSKRLMEEAGLPVYAFVDYDPMGLIIAQALPYFQDIVCPPLSILEDMLIEAGNHHRFITQKAALPSIMNNLEHPGLQAIWSLLDKHANALPQEAFIAT